MKKLPPFDKYEHYFKSVQDTDEALTFLERVYQHSFGKKPKAFGEDFCGTLATSVAWLTRDRHNTSVAVDLDDEPIKYGLKHYVPLIPPQEAHRLKIIKADVRSSRLPKVDAIAALNFSYFIFKTRDELRAYFANCRRRLGKNGLLLLDCFGGSENYAPSEESTKKRGFTYYWEQASYDPMNHHATFFIHFKRNGEKRREKVFRYDWRMWGLAELRELLDEAGFKNVEIYWEGSTKNGEGNGKFKTRKKGEVAETWLTYLAATT